MVTYRLFQISDANWKQDLMSKLARYMNLNWQVLTSFIEYFQSILPTPLVNSKRKCPYCMRS